MAFANRFLVWWVSDAAGEHYETRPTPAAAEALLEEREQREHFVRGVVVDLDEHTQDPEDIDAAHRRRVEGRRVA